MRGVVKAFAHVAWTTTLLAAGLPAASASAQQPLGSVVDAARPLPIGSAVEVRDDAVPPRNVPGEMAMRPVHAAQAAPRAESAPPPPRPLPAADPTGSDVGAFTILGVQAAGGQTTLTVRVPAGTHWSISEPFYLSDRVRLDFEVGARAASGLELPAAEGLLLDLRMSGDTTRTRIEIEASSIGAYEVQADGDSLVLRISGIEAVAAADAAAPVARVSEAAVPTALRIASPRQVGFAAVALGAAVLVLIAGLLALRRRGRPRSAVLGQPSRAAGNGRSRVPADRTALTAAGAARGLAAAGVPPGEIAARLRMSRDAVQLLLARADQGPDEAAGSGRIFPALAVAASAGRSRS